MQLKEGLRNLCDWHLFFVLILRGRYLSARNPEPASPVETWHPHAYQLYTKNPPTVGRVFVLLRKYLVFNLSELISKNTVSGLVQLSEFSLDV